MPKKIDFFQRKPLTSNHKADTISNGAFLIALGILFATDGWWPGILLAIWAKLAVRQFLNGRIYDLVIASFVLIGLFAGTFFQWNWSVVMPVLFVIGGIYIIFREYYFSDESATENQAQDTLDELDDNKRN